MPDRHGTPSALDSQSIREEKVEALRSLIPLFRKEVAASTVRSQNRVCEKDGETVKGYRQEVGVDPRSTTETCTRKLITGVGQEPRGRHSENIRS